MNFIVLDLEATCFKDGKIVNEIIEIGAVMLNEKLERVKTFQIFVKPIINPRLTPFCVQLTSITQEQVDNGMTFSEAVNRFVKWIGDEEYCLCSWGFYDKKQLMQDCQLHKLPTRWIQPHISIKHQFTEIMSLGRGVGMMKALKMLKLEHRGIHHRADSDADNIAEIFIKIYPQLKF